MGGGNDHRVLLHFRSLLIQGPSTLLLLLSHFSRVRLAVPGILQARTLEWVTISFSNVGK